MKLAPEKPLEGVIYITTNLINGKKYIGSDSNNDKYYYGSGVNLKLAIKKYGKSNFKKDILCYCPLDKLREMEEYYCHYYNVEKSQLFYNCTNKGLGSIKGIPHKRNKKVLQYDLQGNFLQEWDSYTDVCSKLNIKTLGSALKGEQKTAGGFIWKYKTNEDFPKVISSFKDDRLKDKPILQIDSNGIVINEFYSMWETRKTFKEPSNIRNALIKGCKAYNFYWKFK
jgi:hypothetical protein